MDVKELMKNVKTGEVVFTGVSKHCFTNKEGKPIILKKELPELDLKFRELIKN